MDDARVPLKDDARVPPKDDARVRPKDDAESEASACTRTHDPAGKYASCVFCKRRKKSWVFSMGLLSYNSTTSVSDVLNSTTQTLSSVCTQATQVSQDIACTVTLDNCPDAVITCGNYAGIRTDCSIDQVASSVVNSVAQAYAEDKSNPAPLLGPLIGISETSSISDVTNQVKQIISNSCKDIGSIQQTLNTRLTCINSKSAYGTFINSASAESQCALSVAADLTSQAHASAKAINDQHNMIFIVIIVVICIVGIIIVAVAGYYISQSVKESRRFGRQNAYGPYTSSSTPGPYTPPVSASTSTSKPYTSSSYAGPNTSSSYGTPAPAAPAPATPNPIPTSSLGGRGGYRPPRLQTRFAVR